MPDLRRYIVIGVRRTSLHDVQLIVHAANEANARVKAELQDVVVTSIEERTSNLSEQIEQSSVPSELTSSNLGKSSADGRLGGNVPSDPRHEPYIFTGESEQKTSTAQKTPSPKPKFWSLSFGVWACWIVVVLAGFIAFSPCIAVGYKRPPDIDLIFHGTSAKAVLSGISYLIGASGCNIVAVLLSAILCFGSKMKAGKACLGLSIAFLLVGVIAQLVR
jgi:hypothetical protein